MIAIQHTRNIVILFVLITFIIFILGLILVSKIKDLLQVKSEMKELKQKINDQIKGREMKNLNLINKIVNDENYIFKDTWDNYHNIVRSEANTDKIIDPNYYFAPDKIIAKYSNRDLANSFPSLLTGIGILGTFIGLVIGLRGLGDFEVLRDQIPTLIGGMRVSFISSLFAIGFSLIYTLLDKYLINSVRKEIDSLNEELKKVLPVRIESNLLDEIVNNQERQLQATNEFITDTLVPEIVNGMQKAVDQSLAPQVQQMNKTMEKVVDATTDKQAESIDKMVNKFMNTFNEAFDHQFSSLQETLKEMINWQKSTKQEMEELIHTVEKSAIRQNKLLENTEDLLSNIEGYLTRFDKLNQNLNQNVSSLDQLSSKLSNLEERTNDKIQMLIDRQDEFDEERSKHLKNMGNQIEEINKFWGSIQSNFTDLNKNLEGAMEQFADNTYEGLERTFNSFDENLASISNRLAVTINDINESVEDIPHSFNQLKEILTEINIEREDLLNELNNQNQIIKEGFSAYNDKLEKNLVELKEDVTEEFKEQNQGFFSRFRGE